MAIPFNITTVNVLRQSQAVREGEPYQNSPYDVVATNIRAVVSLSPNLRGKEVTRGGERAKLHARLICDPADITHLDLIVDLVTQEVWNVEYAHERIGLGLDHITAGLFRTEGRL